MKSEQREGCLRSGPEMRRAPSPAGQRLLRGLIQALAAPRGSSVDLGEGWALLFASAVGATPAGADGAVAAWDAAVAAESCVATGHSEGAVAARTRRR